MNLVENVLVKIKAPNFGERTPHWREVFGIKKPGPNFQRIIQNDMNRFCNQPHPPEMPPTQQPPQQEASEPTPAALDIGDSVYFEVMNCCIFTSREFMFRLKKDAIMAK